MCEVIPNRAAPADILVVDDTPANLDVLVEMLGEQGFRARPVLSGFLALPIRAASIARPHFARYQHAGDEWL